MGADAGFLGAALHGERNVGVLSALRVAHDYRLAPSRYLRLPWPEWGETDFDLTQAFAAHEENLCGCGCNGWRPDCCGDDPSVQCSVVVTTCKGGAAIAAWQRDNPEPEGGTLLGVQWTTPDTAESLRERAKADIEAMLRRHGQPIP